MRKVTAVFLCFLLVLSVSTAVFAASDAPQIVLQPQSLTYPQYSTAIYTVKATGTNLAATWYLEWLGSTYNLSDMTNGLEPWEAYAGESYGPIQNDANTFSCFFGGIEADLDGGYIWCVIEDGHYTVSSQKVRISVGNDNMPPSIVDIPTELTVEQGEEAEIRCVAQAPGDTQLSFLWFETDTGKMEDIRAVNRGTETGDYLLCETSTVGTRYYICQVTTSDGGIAYSSVVKVTVTEKAPPPTEETKPAETKPAETKPAETKPAETKPAETKPAETKPAETKPAETKPEATQAPTTAPTQAPTQPAPQQPGGASNMDVPWWALVMIGLLCAAIGVGTAALLVYKTKK